VVSLGIYAALAVVAAVVVFLLGEWLREPEIAAPDCVGRCAIAAGLLWPVIVVGIGQWGLIAAVQSWLCAVTRSAAAGGTVGLPEPIVR
jgi:hypothetical protein